MHSLNTSFIVIIISICIRVNASSWIIKILSLHIANITVLCKHEPYIWIGTKQGLFQVNTQKLEYRLFTPYNSNLPDDDITCIVCKSDGQTYIGTKNGILFWDNVSMIMINKSNSGLFEDHITALTLDHEECLWIATMHCGVLQGIGPCLPVCILKYT